MEAKIKNDLKKRVKSSIIKQLKKNTKLFKGLFKRSKKVILNTKTPIHPIFSIKIGCFSDVLYVTPYINKKRVDESRKSSGNIAKKSFSKRFKKGTFILFFFLKAFT